MPTPDHYLDDHKLTDDNMRVLYPFLSVEQAHARDHHESGNELLDWGHTHGDGA